ncbi:MAG: right-handed parallel beta-helix repeat-containing protein, partial [Thermoplasmatales archaeon]|nr:right-handed parallel beta-helix repeat-containing protein [Thermoplasmatales archaeon]
TGSDANDDGIGDTPYPISGSGNYDYYPFMEPSGWEEVGLTPHAPIYINGDDDFASQAESEGWIGIGSATNPYIIENYDINAGTAHGIEIRNTNVYFIIRNCMIHDGKISEDGVYGNYGIFFHNVKNGTVDNITSYSNFVGIYMQSLSNNQLINCTVYNNSEGIYLYSASNNQIIKCTVYDNARGIWLDNYPANNQITNSTVYNNPYGISLYYSSNNKIVNCVVYNNGHGLWLYYSSDNQIAKCDVNNSFKNGIYLYYSSNNKIHYCNIYNNTDYGVYNYNSAVEYQVNATYNYWGSASGPGGVGPGNGDEVNYMVLYEPWLVVPWGVEDVVPPQICNIQAFPVSQEIYGYVNITCTITDNVAVNTAKVNVTGPAGFTSINATMTRIAGTNNYYYNITYSIPGKYSYYIFTMDTSNNGNKSAPYEFTIRDTAKPEITNIHGRPFAVANISTGHIVYWRVWISCGVTDNFAVSIVKVNITGPVGFTPINVTMTRYSAPPYTYEFYQYDATYLIAGTYSYYIWANDTSGNEKKSPEYHFTIPIAVAETIDGREVNVIGIGNGTVNIEPVALPQPPPENLQYIGIQVNVTITGTLTYANITIKYNESDAAGIDEAMLRMYYWTGTEWRLCNNTGVNTANNIVWANVSHLTIFVPMAEKVIEAPAPPSNLFLYIGIAVIAAIIIVIFLVLMLAGIGITGVRVVKRRKIPRLQIVKCVYCQATTKITSPDRPLLFQCPKCGGKSVIR